MPPQRQDDPSIQNGSMTRVMSESDFSDAGFEIRSYRDYRVRKSRLTGMIDWTNVLSIYFPQIMVVGVAILFCQIVHHIINQVSFPAGETLSLTYIWTLIPEIKQQFFSLFDNVINTDHALLSTGIKTTIIFLVILCWLVRMDNPVFLLSFSTFKPPEDWKFNHEQIIEMMRRQNCFNESSLEFMRRLLIRSGTGQATAWPPGISRCLKGEKTDRSIEGSREEATTVIYDIVDQALKKANLKPKDIDILVINCSLFSPTPSLCALVVSKFGMRSDISTFNLSGMGCGASLISVDLAKSLLQRRSFGGRALVVSTEIITPNLYHGNERGFLLQNTLFRCGGAAMILSNRWTDGQRALYKLLHIVRVQGADEESYQCVYETEDQSGERGVRLAKDIVKVAGKCMEKNMTMLGPLVLPLSEQLKVVYSIVARKVIKYLSKTLTKNGMTEYTKKFPSVKVYVPDFKRGIDHFCIHAGGRAVIDGIEKNMKLEKFHTEPSRMTLLNYGNTSSSSIWYELEYIQEIQKTNALKKGDRIMQVAFGSGFKCTSGVWLKL